ncbi:MAG: DNA polymerase III delta subunit [Planctomycetota bacterium]|jgi:DNA polymerase III delta subunit
MAKARTREADPGTQLRDFFQVVERDGLPHAALLRGEERYFVERGVSKLIEAAGAAKLELCRHDAQDPDFELSRLLDDLGANPMFASARCVVVRNADSGLLKKVGTKQSPFTRSALSFIESQRAGSLVITGRAIRADHVIAKALKAAELPLLSLRKLYDTPPPWSPDPRKVELAIWVGTRSSELGLKLSPDDCAYLAAATGNDLAAIDTQLEKLRIGGREKLRELVGWNSGGTPWNTADDLLCGDLARGLAAVESLFRSGFHSDRDGKTEVNPAALCAIVLGTLRSKARQGLRGARAVAGGASVDGAATEAGVSAQKMAREAFSTQLSLRGAPAWERVYRDVLHLERKSRSGAQVDVNDFAPLALRWAVKPQNRARKR